MFAKSAAEFADFLADHPRVFEVLEQQICDRLSEERGPSLIGESVEQRLAALMLELVLREGADDGPWPRSPC